MGARNKIIMLPHQERVITEQKDLANKLDRLKEFAASEAFNALPAEEQDRLLRQAAIMDQYVTVLGDLISAFPINPRNEKTAGELYTEYCEQVGGKAFNGDQLPGWIEFRADPAKGMQSDAWVAVAELAWRICR